MLTISIIVPIYNSAKYLKQCVESVINQTYEDWELILVDDGSMDESSMLVDEYEKNNKETGGHGIIRAIHQENKGLSGARNTGLHNAQGKYVMFLDSDDFLENDFLEITLYEALNNDLDMVVTPTRNVSANGEFVEDLKKNEYWRHFGEKHQLIRYNVTPRIYKRSWLEENNLTFSEGELMEDVVFCLATNRLTNKWRLLDYHGYCYRLNPNGIVGGFKKSGISDDKIPYKGLREAVELVLSKIDNDKSMSKEAALYEKQVLEYCIVRILVTIIFVFCKKSDINTVKHMCSYTIKFLRRYFPDFMHNPYFNIWHEENVPKFQSLATAMFKFLYGTHMLKPFAYIYTRF